MASRTPRPCIVWFRDDLRLSDHPALHAASNTGAPVICLYVLDELATNARPLGGAARWWLSQSLRALRKSVEALGSPLVLRRGSAATVIAQLARRAGASSVFWNEHAQAPHQAVADRVTVALNEVGVAAQTFPGDLLVASTRIRSKDGRGLRVFTPFWKRVRSFGDPPKPLPALKALSPVPGIAGDALESWHLEPTRPDWAGGLRETWTPGEASAQAQLRQFLNSGVAGYSVERDRPDREGPQDCRRICALARSARGRSGTPRDLPPPRIQSSPVTSTNSSANWAGVNSAGICCSTFPIWPSATCSPRSTPFRGKPMPGRCGPGSAARPAIPSSTPACVNSGTPAPCTTGCGWWWPSFLVKHLLLDWRDGEKWFWDTLVDADPGSNPANWQWVAGSGADAAPYFRVFNPILQGGKFDPDGFYVRRWVPELAELPARLIHQPWTATPRELAGAGITLGKRPTRSRSSTTRPGASGRWRPMPKSVRDRLATASLSTICESAIVAASTTPGG